ncbi:bifunctional 2-polyprenyl-6-hydroxyphenol methylase/3-demethylubiquinol 3-O-methyltransferase UbiG [Nocardiopsis oceani]
MAENSTHDDTFFGAYADTWWDDESTMAPLKSFNPLRFSYFDRFVDTWEGKRVLDVGCGGGYTTEFLDARGARVSGIDYSPKLIGAARHHAAETGKDIQYEVGVAEELPYEDGAFDIVTCVDVLEHVRSPEQAVREIHRVLAPGGIFLYDTINRTQRSRVMMIWIPERLLGIVPRGAHEWKDFITTREMLAYLSGAGFTPVGKMLGIAIRGQNSDGSLKAKHTKDLSSLYMGVAKR